MKKYKEYMDGVRASDTLHQRLVELEAAGKRPIPWTKYAAIAAALALVCGLGAWGINRSGAWTHMAAQLRPTATLMPEITDAAQPDIATADPGDVTEPGEKTLGGYEVTTGSGPNAMVSYYPLPYIEYGQVEGGPASDWDIPSGVTRRQLTWDEIAALMGGEDALSAHLDWQDFGLNGWGAWYEDGSFWGAYLYGKPSSFSATDVDQLEFAVTAGQLPPTCFAYEESVTQEVLGLTVTADGYDFEQASVRRVSFMKDGYGYRFEASSNRDDRVERTECWASRLVRLVAADGLDLASLTGVEMSLPADGGEGWTCPDCGMHIEAGVEHHHSADGGVDTSYYDPNGYALNAYDPNELAERGINPGQAVPESDSFLTCGTCGGGIPDGTEHYCKLDGSGGYVCGLCGEVFPAGKVHSHEMCRLPLAPDNLICETCGESYTADTVHSHTCECGATYPCTASHSHTCQVCGQTVCVGIGYTHTHTCQTCGESYGEGTAHTCSQGNHHQEHHSDHH